MKFGEINAIQFLGQLFPSEKWLDNKLFLTEYDYAWIETAKGRDVVNFEEWIVSGPEGIRKLYSHEFEEEFGEIDEIPLTNRESSRKSIRG